MKRLNSGFILPKYQDDCFSNIPATVSRLFGVKSTRSTVSQEYFKKYVEQGYKNIILFLVDALGFYQWKRYGNKFPLFKQIDNKKCLYPITAIFPSTTSSALNTINTGLTPAEHGLFEWTLYLPEIDKTIYTLPFTDIAVNKRDSLLEEKVKPEILFDFPTIYQEFKKENINSFSFLNKRYAESVYSKISRKGSETLSFVNFSDLVVKLRTQVENSKGKNYFFIYWDKLDTLSHDYGPSNDSCRVELAKLSFLFLTEIVQKLNKEIKKETLLIITADHGQIDINPGQTIYLNEDKLLMDSFKKDGKGEIIFPTGSPRNVFLHIQEEKLDDIFQYLKGKLEDKADILKIERIIKLGLFGENQVKTEFRGRLGDLIILPYKNFTIWREYQNKKFAYLGHHGGLNREEMIIPFAICGLDEI